jgi:hypothetical protein
VCSVPRTAPAPFGTCTSRVEYIVVVVVSDVSTCSQNDSVADEQPAGIVTPWASLSVVAV